jgi:hypothetical protein
MAMNIVAGGVGVTLTKAYNMIINDFDWTPSALTQAEDRICRGGQTEEYCNIYYLYANGADMDEVFADTLTYKFGTIDTVVDGGVGDTIDYIDLLNEALERSTGIKKIRRMSDVVNENNIQSEIKITSNTNISQIDYSKKSVEELWEICKNNKIDCKQYSDIRIQRMRLVMAIKKGLNSNGKV